MAEDTASTKSSFEPATNWEIIQGSLLTTVSFESALDEDQDQICPHSKAPLLLKPPPSDSRPPCEIHVRFDKKYEVRQVYVHSTARVYEIYYARDELSSNEYLCTVRCGIAAREGCTAQMNLAGEAMAEDHGVCNSEKASEVPKQAGKSDSINSNSSDEDGWVEVKVPDPPLHSERRSSMTNCTNQSIGMTVQDYFEATAEITDPDPCTILTLRFLSLQVKEIVAIDEIYIFAEPVPADASQQLAPVEGSASSNLLAMLVPSLLQLSKSGSSRVQDGHASDIRAVKKSPDSEPKATMLIDQQVQRTISQETPFGTVNQGELQVQEPTKVKTENGPLQSDALLSIPENVLEHGERKEFKVCDLENMLDQLNSRVGRIESFCVRFEENMLKPLNCMSARLERLEQHLNELTLRSQTPPISLACTQIATSGNYCEPQSQVHDDDTINGVSETERKFNPDDQCSSDADATASPISSDYDAHLVATAPELSNSDDNSEGDNDDNNDSCNSSGETADGKDTSELVGKDVPLNKPSLSIDSALASALASLILSTSTESSKPSPAFMIKAPDFSDENVQASPCTVCHEITKSYTSDFHGADGTDNVEDSDSVAHASLSQDVKLLQEANLGLPKESLARVTKGEVAENQLDMDETGECRETGEQVLNDRGKTVDVKVEVRCEGIQSLKQADTCCFEDDDTDSTVSATASQNQIIAESTNRGGTDSEAIHSNWFCANHNCTKATLEGDNFERNSEGINDDSSSALLHRDVAQVDPTANNELCRVGWCDNGLNFELEQASHPVLDFKLPILDVKFVSQERVSPKLSLETLLGDVPEMGMQACKNKNADDNNTVLSAEQNFVDYAENGEEKGLPVNDPFSKLEDLTMKITSPNDMDEEPYESSVNGTNEPFPSLI